MIVFACICVCVCIYSSLLHFIIVKDKNKSESIDSMLLLFLLPDCP